MNDSQSTDTDFLLGQVAAGSTSAFAQLLSRHCERLERLVRVRMDPRAAQRFDPADVVQDALLDAHRKLDSYLRERPLPFYPWLRQLVLERLLQLHRRHLWTKGRSVTRELHLPDESVAELAELFVSTGTSPSSGARREESREQVRRAIGLLSEHDREVLVMRFLEHLDVGEIAAVLKLTPGAVCARQLRAIKHLRSILDASDF